MVFFTPIHLAVYCFAVSAHGTTKLSRNTLAATVHAMNQQNTTRNKAFENVFTTNEYFRKLTRLDDTDFAKYKVTIGDDAHENNNLLTKSSNEMHDQSSDEDFDGLQKLAVTDNAERIMPERLKKGENPDMQNIGGLEYSGDDNDMSASGLNSSGHTAYNARRIYRGHKAKIKHFPFLVTVHVLGRFICSGSIIRANLVITAASCLKRWQEWKKYQPITKPPKIKTTRVKKPSTAKIKTTKSTFETTEAETDTPTTSTDETSTTTYEDTTYTGTTTEVTTETETTETQTTETQTTITTTTTETIETTTDWTTTSPETTETTQMSEVSEVWSRSKPPKLSALAVRIGTNFYRLGGKVVTVVKVYFHPSYVYSTLRNNLAILRLERHVNVTRRRVQVVDFSRVAAGVRVGTNVTIAGWGAKTYYNKVYNALWNRIHQAVLKVSSYRQCRDQYSSVYVQETNFCALSANHEGACNRDVGNPAVVGNLLVGVTSFGSPTCGPPDHPTVFTNVGYYAGWIQNIMDIAKFYDPPTTQPPPNTDQTAIETEIEIVATTDRDLTERRNWMNMEYGEYYPRNYRRSQNLSQLNFTPRGTQGNRKETEASSKYDTGRVLTMKPEIRTSLQPTNSSELSIESDSNNLILTHITKASYDTIDRPYIGMNRPTKSIAALYDFTPHAYPEKNSGAILVDYEGSRVAEGHLTTATKDDNHVSHIDDYEDNKLEETQATDNRLGDDNDNGVTHPYKYQIEAPPLTSFGEIKDEMEKIIGQLDLNVFGSDMTDKWKSRFHV